MCLTSTQSTCYLVWPVIESCGCFNYFNFQFFTDSFFFGFAIGVIGCYKGYYSKKGTEGVGRSANSAVVVSSLLVFILDLIAVQITDLLGLT